MSELASFAKPASLRAAVRGLADRRHINRTHDTAASRLGPVGRHLDRLGADWHVVDASALAHRSRVEHLVIGPAGVFVISGAYDARRTVCLGADNLLIDGKRVHHVRDSREAVAEVSDRLTSALGQPVPVTALVLIFGDRRFAVPAQRDDAAVRVMTATAGVRWLRRRSAEWTAADVERVCAVAVDAATWLPTGVSAQSSRRSAR